MPDIDFTAPDFGGNFFHYLKEVKSELKKVEWPTKQEVIKATTLVVLVSLITGAILGGLDIVFTKIFSILLK